MTELIDEVLSMRKVVDKAAAKKERLSGEKDALTKQIKKEFGVDTLKGVEKMIKDTKAKRDESEEKLTSLIEEFDEKFGEFNDEG